MTEEKQQRIKMPHPATHEACREQETSTLLEARKNFDLLVEHWTKFRVELQTEYDVSKALETLEHNKRVISEILDERLAL